MATKTDVHDIARKYRDGGLSVISIATDGTKSPIGVKWKPYQKERPTDAQLRRMFNGRPVGIAAIGGKVSGDLEAIDFDETGLFEKFAPVVEKMCPGLIGRLTRHQTPRPGMHLIHRCDEIEGNQDLALRAVDVDGPDDVVIGGKSHKPVKTDDGRWIVVLKLIETRGEGGYFLVPGCPPECHDTGRTYEHVAGPPITDAPRITSEERKLLLAVARSFNEFHREEVETARPKQQPNDGLSPGDDFAQRTTWTDILAPHNWVEVHASGDMTYWRRPGKSKGWGATSGCRSQAGTELFCVFSSSAYPFEVPAGQTCGTYSKFATFTVLNHGGDFRAAARGLAGGGLGEQRQSRAGGGDCLADARQRTDSANARRFARMHKGRVRWCEPWQKWLVWDGRRWAIDIQRLVQAKGQEVCEALWQAVAEAVRETEDKKLVGELLRFAKATSNAVGIRYMLEVVRGLPGLPILPEDLDTNEWFLNVENGTIDLRTGERRAHDPENMLTKLAPVVHDPEADCPEWRRFLLDITDDNKQLVEYLRRLLGLSLTGSTAEHILAFCYGTGANGKSTFMNAIQELLGPDYSMKAPADLLMVKRSDAHPTERADLFGKRFVVCIEADKGRRLAEGIVKEMTGGDRIRARRMREDHWEFVPTHKLWLAANHKPVIRGTDQGIWRRVKLIPFTVTVPSERQDKQLPEKLAAERSGILNWALLGCADWQERGLEDPPEVTIATAQYRKEQDVLGAFLDDRCLVDAGAQVKAGDLFDAYKAWCDRSGERAETLKAFGSALTERGFDSKRTKNGVLRFGVGLRVEGEG